MYANLKFTNNKKVSESDYVMVLINNELRGYYRVMPDNVTSININVNKSSQEDLDIYYYNSLDLNFYKSEENISLYLESGNNNQDDILNLTF